MFMRGWSSRSRIGANGDTFDRYLVRILEMRESVKIVQQCIDQIEPGPIKTDGPFFRPPSGRRCIRGGRGAQR